MKASESVCLPRSEAITEQALMDLWWTAWCCRRLVSTWMSCRHRTMKRQDRFVSVTFQLPCCVAQMMTLPLLIQIRSSPMFRLWMFLKSVGLGILDGQCKVVSRASEFRYLCVLPGLIRHQHTHRRSPPFRPRVRPRLLVEMSMLLRDRWILIQFRS